MKRFTSLITAVLACFAAMILGVLASALVSAVILAGCATSPSPSPSPASTGERVVNPLLEADIAAGLRLANEAGVSNADTSKAQSILVPVSRATDAIAANQSSGAPVDQQVLADAAAAAVAYQRVKAAIATHPAVVDVVKGK